MVNDAVYKNTYDGVEARQDLTSRGSDWLWAVFAIMTFADLVVIAWHFTIPRGQRVFHQAGAVVLTTAAVAYFSLASNLGQTPVPVEFSHADANGFPVGSTRAIWYVRYIDWVITTPALLLSITLATGLPLGDIITLVFFDLVMIITGLVGALVPSSYKWGYFAFGCAAEVYIWWVLLGPAVKSSALLGDGFKKAYIKSAALLSFLWLLYPIAWGLADGGNVITTDSEMIFYGILDVFAKPVFLIFHLFSIRNLDLSLLQLSSGKFSSANNVAAYDQEKNAAAPGAKKGMFGTRGRFNATEAAAPVDNTAGPRPSNATAVAA